MITRNIRHLLKTACGEFGRNNVTDSSLRLLYCYAMNRDALERALPSNMFSTSDSSLLHRIKDMLYSRGLSEVTCNQVFSFLVPFSYMEKGDKHTAVDGASQICITTSNPFDPNSLVFVVMDDRVFTTKLEILDGVLSRYEHPEYMISFQDLTPTAADLPDTDIGAIHSSEDIRNVFDAYLIYDDSGDEE
jgi:hypothetical protein